MIHALPTFNVLWEINTHSTHLWQMLIEHNTVFCMNQGREKRAKKCLKTLVVESESSSSWILPPSSTESRHQEHYEYNWCHSSPSPTPPQTVREDNSISSPHLRNLVTSTSELKEYEHPHYNPSLWRRDSLKEDKSKLKLCGYQSHLFIKSYSICHQQFSCVYCADK